MFRPHTRARSAHWAANDICLPNQVYITYTMSSPAKSPPLDFQSKKDVEAVGPSLLSLLAFISSETYGFGFSFPAPKVLPQLVERRRPPQRFVGITTRSVDPFAVHAFGGSLGSYPSTGIGKLGRGFAFVVGSDGERATRDLRGREEGGRRGGGGWKRVD